MPSERCCCKVLRYCSNIASPALATEYAGRGGGKALLNARVERDGTTYRVKLEVASPTCIGRVHLTGKVGNSVLLTGKQCTVRARFQREPSRSRKIRAPRAHRVNQTRWPSRYCADCRGQRDGRAAPDASIDAVVSQEAFCHVPDVKKVVAEAFRIRRTDGRLAFTDWISRLLREEARQAGIPMGHDAFHKSYIRFVDPIQERKRGGVRMVATKQQARD